MNYAIIFLLSFGLAIAATPLAILVSKKYGFVDDPRRHRHPAILHNRVIPRGGGLVVYLATFLAALVFLPISKELVGIFLGGLILVGIGLWDDRRDLRNSVKLTGQVLAALVVIASGIGIAFITNPLLIFSASGLGLGPVIHLDIWRLTFNFLGEHSIVILADLFALFWIVWVINMVNFSSGVDGQMPGIVLVAFIVIFLASLRFVNADPSQLIVTKLSLIGAGATLGFLIFNFYPAKIFPGDSGSYFLGYLVAVCAILATARVGAALLVMAVPLIDGVFTIIRRVASGNSPFIGDRKHLHHQLLQLGWGQRRVALFYYFVCVILGAAALALSSFVKIFAGVVAAVVILGGLIWLNFYLPQKAK